MAITISAQDLQGDSPTLCPNPKELSFIRISIGSLSFKSRQTEEINRDRTVHAARTQLHESYVKIHDCR